MSEIILDSVIDSIKLLPFLFLTYLFMEWLEHKTGAAARKRIRTAGKFGPVWGGLLGVIPQCGFSAAASSLFAGRVITVGTLIAVYLSTSDEMFPIMISNAVPVVTIVKILTCKAVIGILSGLVLEYVYTHILKKQEPDVDIHEICEEERCHCEHGVISSAAFHTLKVFVYIFLISLVLNIIIGFNFLSCGYASCHGKYHYCTECKSCKSLLIFHLFSSSHPKVYLRLPSFYLLQTTAYNYAFRLYIFVFNFNILSIKCKVKLE